MTREEAWVEFVKLVYRRMFAGDELEATVRADILLAEFDGRFPVVKCSCSQHPGAACWRCAK